jgi:heat shock protein HtpX
MMPPVKNLNPDIQRQHNFRNALHTAILVVGSAALMGLIAYTVFGTLGLFIAGGMTIAGIFMLGNVSPKIVLNLYKARALPPDELPEVHRLVRELATRANLPSIPQLYYVPSKVMNAFAVGRPEESAIAVTDGLLRAMTMRQIAGILAHETSHIASGDLKVMGLADVLNRVTGMLSTMGLLGVPLVFGMGVNLPLAGLLLLIFAPTIGGLLQLALSRAREYDADLDGASLTGDPEGLALALKELEERQRGMWEGLFLPGGRMPQPSLLRSHPKTADRIARLMAIRADRTTDIDMAAARPRPSPSLVPPIRNPHVQWHRLGIYN